MKKNTLWLILSFCLTITLSACGGDDNEETTAGTETAGTDVAGTETAGTNVAGTETAGTSVAGTETAGTSVAGTETAGTDAGMETAGTDVAGTETAGMETAGMETAGMETAGMEMMMGACTNSGDLGRLESLGDVGLSEAITSCITMCFNPTTCAPCLEGATGLSTECSTCFVEITTCTINNCVGQCLDSASDACAQCRADNCNDAFVECSGVEPR